MYSFEKKNCLFVILWACLIFPAYTQETCEQTLNQATAEFEAGRFYSVPTLLSSCLASGFTSDQRFRAYYILTQAYLVLDDPIGAENSYLKLLAINPEFKPNEKDDPIDLVYLSEKFTTRPRFTPHYRVGANVSFPHSIYGVNTFSSTNVKSNQTQRVGIQAGAGVDWNLTDHWSIGVEANFSTKSFAINSTGIAIDDDLNVIDKSTWVDVPIYIKYSYDSGKWRPFAYAGFALNLLISNTASLIFNDRTSQTTNTKIAQGPDVDLAFQRNLLNRSLLVGGGVKYKIGKNFVYVDARYMMGLNNITIPEKSYYTNDGSLATTISTYQYVSDFFRLDNLSLSIGYIKPLYDPRKLKTGSSKSFIKNIFRKKPKKS
jgi:hypothetical protein